MELSKSTKKESKKTNGEQTANKATKQDGKLVNKEKNNPDLLENMICNDRENRTVFVGNLPKTINRIKLKKWFSKYGPVETVRLRCPPLADPRVSKKVAVIKKMFHADRTNIHAYVRFTSNESAIKSLEANNTLFDENHHIRVDISNNTGNYDYKKAVFIGNLPFGTEEEQLRHLFDVCGQIDNIRIVRDHRTGVGKGIAYINFVSEDAVELALKMDGEMFDKRELRVKRSLANPKTGNRVASQNKNRTLPKQVNINEKEMIFQGKTSSESKKNKKKKLSSCDKRRKIVQRIFANSYSNEKTKNS